MVSNLHEDAPAKINLHLKVTACRSDGYHELDISFWPLYALSDQIELEFRPRCLRLACNDKNLPEHGNICLTAAEKYATATGIEPEWFFNLHKNIPLAAGLGGGSSDAAAVLRMLNRHYKVLSAEQLAELAVSIGADVPYFLDPRPAFATGIGEKLFYPEFKLPELHVLLVNPGFPVSASWAYRHLNPSRIGPGNNAMLDSLKQGHLDKIAAVVANDLEEPVLRKFPLLTIIKQTLLEHGATAACMSGSGPTLFALTHSRVQQEKIRDTIGRIFPFCRIFVC
ncbi:MAG: 4-(cytidine 5'-diphospho)-2-C-methyl-D-erythritol kinase [Lentisphaerae bacterium]|nr:4-(cytidine 5'-diphospho)-2-C-methyl-D-erythritol kinase [Lentisphaerota bacterium]